MNNNHLSGNHWAFYSQLWQELWHGQVFLTGNSGTITLEGKRLDLIGQRIKHGDLSYVRESNKSNPVTTDEGVCVTSIRFA